MPWDLPNPFIHKVQVRSLDIDGLGHSNNACYVIWCEASAWKHSESLGLSVHDYQRLDRGVAIQKANYEYFLPSFEGDSLLVGTWLVDCDNRLRLRRKFQIINQDSSAVLLRGTWDLVSVTLSSGRATRMPKLFSDTYGNAVIQVD